MGNEQDAPGRPESPGKSEAAPGHNKPETKPVEPADATPEQVPAGTAADADVASESAAIDEGAPDSSGAVSELDDDDGREGA